MKVPFVDLEPQHQVVGEEIRRRLDTIFETTHFIGGPEVEEFEERFASYCGCRHAVGVDNGTNALEMALRALGIGPGDTVATAANTFVATVEAIHATGADPVLVDPDPVTSNLTVESLEPLDPGTLTALVPVHLYGRPAEMDALSDWSERHGVHLVEDAAQAHGARTGGRMAGAWGELGCFSFYPSKNLGAYGDAGAVVTDDPEAAERIRMFGDHGSSSKYDHTVPGTNSRLDAVQAAVLNAKLSHLDDWNDQRRAAAERYREALKGIDPVSVMPEDRREQGRTVYHLFTVSVPASSRGSLRAFLEDRGVGTGIHYPTPVHLTSAFRHLGDGTGSFPVAERLARRTLSLPMYPGLTDDQVDHVASQIVRFFSENGDPS